MRVVLLGPPGAGKGTQSKLLQEHFRVPQISTGDILRRAVAERTELGEKAKQYMERGQLIPDDLIIGIVEKRLAEADCAGGFLLDGFPRTIPQTVAFDRILAKLRKDIDGAVRIRVPKEELVRRLSGRRTCQGCGRMYHVAFNPPKRPGVCDVCGGRLEQRNDDREETIGARLDVYEKQTAPLYEYFAKRDRLREVDGTGSTNEVFGRILKAVEPEARA